VGLVSLGAIVLPVRADLQIADSLPTQPAIILQYLQNKPDSQNTAPVFIKLTASSPLGPGKDIFPHC